MKAHLIVLNGFCVDGVIGPLSAYPGLFGCHVGIYDITFITQCVSIYDVMAYYVTNRQILGEPLRAKYYGGLEKTSISHDRKYCAVIG